MSPGTMGVKLEAGIQARLKKLAESKRRSVHWLMKDAIQRYVDVEERFEQEREEDEARYQAYLDTGNHISNEDMMSWLSELAAEASGGPTAE